MKILSDNTFYTQGILCVLNTIKNTSDICPDKSSFSLYIVTSTAVSGISLFLSKNPITDHAVFICSHKIQHIINRRYPDVIKYFIDENASISTAKRILQQAITGNHVRGTQKILQDIIRLSEKERVILSLLRQGYDIKSIANLCDVSIKTIYSHKKNVMKKHGVSSLQEFYHFMLKQ
ncbi:hypothetical protein A3462_05990 [Enterobacter bugandensis]|jgi:Response regulator|uniref:helix-turn-helix transcriptional regulator n=1 Tax=Enterobacter bugandensis TaxID=881260 RepID=UPI0007B349F0|nr:LuxR C-terminal-related transcriptional regulator [Enterobacter bugandensis]KZP65743.1 hypothetical protein A3462_05990 [Enterobacter bugandensis]